MEEKRIGRITLRIQPLRRHRREYNIKMEF
jgi:hypothetical protein